MADTNIGQLLTNKAKKNLSIMTSLETEESGHCREVFVIERFKHESMLCGEVAISEGFTEEYLITTLLSPFHFVHNFMGSKVLNQ